MQRLASDAATRSAEISFPPKESLLWRRSGFCFRGLPSTRDDSRSWVGHLHGLCSPPRRRRFCGRGKVPTNSWNPPESQSSVCDRAGILGACMNGIRNQNDPSSKDFCRRDIDPDESRLTRRGSPGTISTRFFVFFLAEEKQSTETQGSG
ncbi:hypothetical protein LX32DRAFT_212606 [Colletotrichum zoysiae]|uniref:Uncharacterized protein n=1 Tax=Colletotrichum zoysiae TaxID=1216348 RepID=A0AAD9H693_9PEZI|nr:hypothetical protein LX32DRAFT_212606 [Colletotrichum zoysiae]